MKLILSRRLCSRMVRRQTGCWKNWAGQRNALRLPAIGMECSVGFYRNGRPIDSSTRTPIFASGIVRRFSYKRFEPSRLAVQHVRTGLGFLQDRNDLLFGKALLLHVRSLSVGGLYLSTQGVRPRGRPSVECYEVAELSHAWSGGKDDLLSRDAKGPDASLLIWNFFKQFSR
jgi:hypothetical protein